MADQAPPQDPTQALYQLFRNVNGQITSLTTTVGAQGVAKIIPSFDGSEPKKFKEWVKDIEKHATLTGVTSERVRFIAYQASSGPVSDFLKRHLNAHRDADWPAIRQELRLRFGEVVDSQHALLLLRKCKQKHSETIQVYAERLRALGEEAFEDQATDLMESQLVGYFIDGLAHDYMKMKVMRARPTFFSEAVLAATEEQNLRKRFQLRTGHETPRSVSNDDGVEPMDISHARPRLQCRYCNKKGHHVRDCRVRKYRQSQVNAAGSKTPVSKQDVICYNCGYKGHYARECRKPKKQSKN